MQKIVRFFLPTLFALMSFAAPAQDLTPVGLWKNIDDVTGKPKGLIRITEKDGQFSGTIEKLFRAPDEDQHPLCTKCEGAEKDKPILGMMILSGLKKDGDEYSGGKIVDPNNGKTYDSKLTVEEGGEKLSVRGYIKFSFLGRTQTWIREK